MAITREQLNKLLEGIATSHWQIHTYGWGDVPDLLAREDVIYPFMMVTPQTSVYGDNTIDHTYTISIADRVLKGKENEVAVDSDTHQILMDVVTQLDNLLYDDVDLIKGISVTPFFDNFRHEVTGHFANVTVQVMYNYDACAVPSDAVVLPIPPPSSCVDAFYTVQYVSGGVIESGTIPSGGSKTILVPDCEDATWELRDSAGVLLDSGSIAAGGSETITAPDGVVTIEDSIGGVLHIVNVTSGGSETQVIGNSSATVRNTNGSIVDSASILAEGSANLIAPDANVTVNGVNFVDVPSDTSKNIQVRKSTGNDLIGSKQGQYWRIPNSVITNGAGYSANVKATEGLTLPTQTIEVNGVNEGAIPSVGTIEVEVTDGVNPVAPNDVTITGRKIEIEVSTGVTMYVDFTADKLVVNPLENIQFTDLSDENPTHWSWRFGDGSSSQVQNPLINYPTSGFFDVTLLAGRVGAGGVNIKSSFIEVQNVYFSDLYGIPAVCYSLRKLTPTATYNGAAIRVRRSSDNTEQDINFVSSAANAGIDTSALLSFVGAGNGFITTWYNQNGSGNHLTQTTAGNQPRIVNGGVVEIKNTKTAIDFNGSSNSLQISQNILGASSASAFSISSFDNNTKNQREIIYGSQRATSTRFSYLIARQANNASSPLVPNHLDFYVQGNFENQAGTVIDTNQRLFSNFYTNNVRRELYQNGTIFKTYNDVSLGALTQGTDFIIGRDIVNDAYFDGKFQELIIYNSDQLSQRTAIETNINNYYNVF